MKKDFMEIDITNTLNEIKDCIKGKINLSEAWENSTDKEMSFVLENLIKGNFKNIRISIIDEHLTSTHIVLKLTDDKEKNKVLLVLYYTAIYFGNVILLNKMLEEEVDFGNRPNDLNLYVLDKYISSEFKENEYIEIVKDCMGVFEGFYRTTEDLPEKEREKYITRFAKILKARHKDLTKDLALYESLYGSSHKYLYERLYVFDRLFSISRMDIYDDDSYLKASKEQLYMMCEMSTYDLKNEGTIRRLNNLIQTTDFSQFYPNADLMFSLFSDDELFRLDYNTGYFFSKISDSPDKLNKAMDFYNKIKDKIEGDLNICFSSEAFMMVDNETLVEISNKLGYIPGDTELMDIVTQPKSKAKLKRRKRK